MGPCWCRKFHWSSGQQRPKHPRHSTPRPWHCLRARTSARTCLESPWILLRAHLHLLPQDWLYLSSRMSYFRPLKSCLPSQRYSYWTYWYCSGLWSHTSLERVPLKLSMLYRVRQMWTSFLLGGAGHGTSCSALDWSSDHCGHRRMLASFCPYDASPRYGLHRLCHLWQVCAVCSGCRRGLELGQCGQ